jgi:PAS domain S-box-containing protein
MENKINTLLYNFKEKNISAIHEKLANLGYVLVQKLVTELGKLKSEIMNFEWDVIVIDHNNNNSLIEEILDFMNDLNRNTNILIVSDKIDSELVQLAFKNSKNDIVSKTDNTQISLSLIRNYEKARATKQFDFTKKELLRNQHSLKEHYNFLNQVIESTENPIFYKGSGGIYLGCNEAFAKFIGLPKDKIIGKTVFDVSPKEHAQKYYEMDQAFFRNPVVQKYEYKVVHAEGFTMDVLFHKSPLKDEDGNVIGLLGHMFDVTNKQEIEKALKDSEQKYKMLVENMQEGIGIVDLDETVVFSNEAFDKMFGCEPGEMLGQNLKDYIVEEDLPNVLKQTARKKENQTSIYKLDIIRKDKKKRTLIISSVPWKNSNNEIMGAIGLVIDITAQEFSTKQLHKKIKIEQSIITISSKFISVENFQSKLDEALQEIKNIIEAERYSVITIQNKKIKLISELFNENVDQNDVEFVEIPFDEFKYGLKLLEHFGFIFFDDISNLPDEAIAEKELFEKYSFFNFLGIPFYVGSEIAGIISIINIYDVNEWTIEDLSVLRTISDIIGHAFSRNKAEEKVKQLNLDLSVKNEELEQVVYVTSHDIRSPVVNILGFSDEMTKALNKLSDKIFIETNRIQNKDEIEYILKKDVPQILNFIKVSGQKIDKLLMALLKLSRLGRAAINKTNVDMNNLVKTVVNNFEYIIKQDNIHIQIEELKDCFTDEVAINQVFSNLIDNSIKYKSHERETQIKISCKEDDGNIIYIIEDNGIGIPEGEISKIFDVFYRIDPENQQGEGIGLSLIKKIIERLDGKISVGSKEGEGTKFFISLEKLRIY